MSEMPLPVGGGNLVADQLVNGLGIGDAQQRLGETHQSHALLRGQGIFVQKGVEPAADPLPAHCGYEPAGGYAYPVARLGRQFGGDDNASVGLGFVEAMPVADCRPQLRLDRRRFTEDPVHRRRTGPDAAGCQARNTRVPTPFIAAALHANRGSRLCWSPLADMPPRSSIPAWRTRSAS